MVLVKKYLLTFIDKGEWRNMKNHETKCLNTWLWRKQNELWVDWINSSDMGVST